VVTRQPIPGNRVAEQNRGRDTTYLVQNHIIIVTYRNEKRYRANSHAKSNNLDFSRRLFRAFRNRRLTLEIAIESEQPSPPLAQQQRRVHTITDRFSMANTYLINEERIVVVDPGSHLNVCLIQEYLRHFLHR